MALLPENPDSPVKDRLNAIAAEAKIAHATSQAEALNFLSPAEQLALLESRALIETFAKLPQ
ncbi:hypothetical protein ACFSS8_18195 [Paracoccus kondratievae]